MRLRLLACPVLLWGAIALPLTSAAATFTVTALDDADNGACTPSHCSLREAVNAANITPGADIINFAISGAIFPVSAYTLVDPGTTINGSGAAIIVDGSHLSSPNNIFDVLTSSAAFSRFTIQNAPNNGISVCTGAVDGCPGVPVTSFIVHEMTIVGNGERAVLLCCGEKRNILITRSVLSGRGGIGIFTRPSVSFAVVDNRTIVISNNVSIVGTDFEGVLLAEQIPGFGFAVHESVFIQNNLQIAGADVGVRIGGGANYNVQISRNSDIAGTDGIIVTGINQTGAPNRVSGNQVSGRDINEGTGILLAGADRTIVSNNRVTNFLVGIAVQTSSDGNSIVLNTVGDTGEVDLFWDGGGLGNIWRGNECDISRPAGLCG
jgi:CSLREA domain-containing protein